MRSCALLVAAMGFALAARTAAAQTEYYNTDGGRPIRIEDATPTERFSLDIHLPTFRLDRLDAGAERWRTEPSVSYGFLPRTALEMRGAFVWREPAARPRGGLSGVGIALEHAINTETTRLPAFALGGEAYLPAGSARSGNAAYAIRSMLSRSGRFGRVHLNATYGNYGVALVRPVVNSGCGSPPTGCDSLKPIPIIPDGPCSISVNTSDGPQSAAMLCSGGGAAPAIARARADSVTRRRGAHWLAGLGVDRALPLVSMLVMADVFAERYVGLFDRTDWTAEIGLRKQFTTRLMIDVAGGRHFAGVNRSWVLTTGATWTAALHPFPLRAR